MRIIQEKIDGSLFHSRILQEYFDKKDIIVADIETTGLSPRSSQVVLGGLVIQDGEDRQAVQFFADRPEDEEELLERYVSVLVRYPVIVTYNGHAFDLPFLKKRMKTHGIDASALDRCVSFDLFRVLKRHSDLPSVLPDLKQKTVENYLGIGHTRRDRIDGSESVRLYYQYLSSSGVRKEELLDQILLHNRDDIVQLSDILRVLRSLDLHEILYHEGFTVSSGEKNALIRRILVGNKGMSIEGDLPGALEPYRGFGNGEEAEIDGKGAFIVRIHMEDVEGYRVVDLKALESDVAHLRELPGYESGYLILRNPDKEIRYQEANRLARVLIEKLIASLTFQEQIRIG